MEGDCRRGLFGMRVFFPCWGSVQQSSLSGQPKQIFEPLKNNELFCCPANPFLDAWFWLTDRCAYQAISKGICNYLLFIDRDTFREKTRVSRTYSCTSKRRTRRRAKAPLPGSR